MRTHGRLLQNQLAHHTVQVHVIVISSSRRAAFTYVLATAKAAAARRRGRTKATAAALGESSFMHKVPLQAICELLAVCMQGSRALGAGLGCMHDAMRCATASMLHRPQPSPLPSRDEHHFSHASACTASGGIIISMVNRQSSSSTELHGGVPKAQYWH